MKVLCVAEKNKISKSVSASLSRNNFQSRNTKSKYVKNYSFRFNFPQWGDCDVIMTAVSGHIMQKEIPSDYGWGKVPNDSLFKCPIVTRYGDDNAKKIAENISELAKSSDVLMIWTDCDREGEYIGWEILKAAQEGNSSFTLDNVYRARFSHLESKHIYSAACNPVRLDKLAIDAVDTRMEIDLRTGYCFTRLLTDSFRNVIKSDSVDDDNNNGNSTKNKKKNDKMISYGNCQFPTLGFVVDRFRRIKYFKEEEFWGIDLNLKKDRKKFPFIWERNRLFDRLQTVCIYQNCINEQSDNVVVKHVSTNPTTRYAPLPLTTVELQKDCSRYFKFSAKDTLQVAENLYTKGLISYPRTETDSFPRSMDFRHFITMQTASSEWGEYSSSLLNETNHKFRVPRRGKHDDEAHPPIHPVGYADNLTGKEKTIYEYVVRRFLASCSLDATGSMTSIKVQWATETFHSTGLVVLERNYLDIFKWDHWDSSKKGLPNVAVGEHIQISDATISSGKTAPPQPLTETELISLMDVNGIGTDATIADHIDKILTREYIIKQKLGSGKSSKEVFHPTILGYGLADGFGKLGFNNISLTKPFMRKDMENDLADICQGSKPKGQVLKETLDVYRDAYTITDEKVSTLVNAYKTALNHSRS
ncbi:hypothetical protein PMKS-002538 [Pichia membranifaciens]|uniref:DNA topoisomerase n=1 Tax=Pichia membranifaciens TaxID=4926 RepID=A0A1Q2YHQ4_9ASCO|nr:hypothetical protein PMKS-002538 [Pichia membranifaciens]